MSDEVTVDDASASEIRLLVTVGSTNFATLTEYVSSRQCLDGLKSVGVRHTTIQYGTHRPTHEDTSGHSVEMFAYTPSLKTHMENASIVVSHAGAGTVLEAVNMGKPLVVVINTSLMDNHQTELARAMEARNCCVVVNQEDIESDLVNAVRKMLQPNRPRANPPKRQRGAFARIVTQELLM